MLKLELPSKIVGILFRGILFSALFAGNLFAQTGLDYLAAQINRGNSEQQRNALFEISNLKTAEASRLALPALQSRDEIVRATAAKAVAFLPPDEAVRDLLPLLRDKKPLVRKEAAYALGLTRSPQAVNPLIELTFRDKIQEVKDAATVALGEIGDPSAIERLTGILQSLPKPPEEFMRRAAARSVGQIAQLIQTGILRVQTPQNSLISLASLPKTKRYSDLAKTYSVFRQALSVTIRVLQSAVEFPDVKREAAFALGAIGDPAATSVLRANLNNEDYYLAQICREALAKIENN